MFAVIDHPRSPREYNDLPDVVDAEAALEPLQAELSELIQRASAACSLTPFPSGSLGGVLLHKHWVIDDGQSMIERPGRHPSGRPALSTSARSTTELSSAAPSRFKVDPQRGELIALEFSDDPVVFEVWRSLSAQSAVLDRLCAIISVSGLADKVGLGIISRSLAMAAGESMVEESFDHESVVTSQIPMIKEGGGLIQTAWEFVASDGGAPICAVYCEKTGNSAHDRWHYRTKPV